MTDMIPFFALVLITIAFFAVLNSVDPYYDNYFDHAYNQYRFMFGENPETSGMIQLSLYVFFSLFMCIVMLNLLIAIISETFA
jgi:energy-coupling factor transporter transmembrane protein EcfT